MTHICPAMAHIFSAMGSNNTHFPNHGIGNGKPWHTFSRPWTAMAHIFSAMGSHDTHLLVNGTHFTTRNSIFSDELNLSQIACFFLSNDIGDKIGDKIIFSTKGRHKKSPGDKFFISSLTVIVL